MRSLSLPTPVSGLDTLVPNLNVLTTPLSLLPADFGQREPPRRRVVVDPRVPSTETAFRGIDILQGSYPARWMTYRAPLAYFLSSPGPAVEERHADGDVVHHLPKTRMTGRMTGRKCRAQREGQQTRELQENTKPQDSCCCCCCRCLHIINHPGLSSQYLLLSQPLRTNPTLDSANFRGQQHHVENTSRQDKSRLLILIACASFIHIRIYT